MIIREKFRLVAGLGMELAMAAPVAVPRSYYRAFRDYGSSEKVAKQFAVMFPLATGGMSLAGTAAVAMLLPQVGPLALVALAYAKWSALSVYLYKDFADAERRGGNDSLARHNVFFPSLAVLRGARP